MSLKGFHIVFLIVSVLFSFGLALWGVMDFRRSDSAQSLAIGITGLVMAALLIPYGVWFLRKLKNVSAF
jgi:hypothetical protein